MAPVAMKLLAASAFAAAPGALASLQVSGRRVAEGEDLMIELADIVLGNKQAVLPIPFEMILERDVGYVGEHPIMENSTAVAKLESLKTEREVNNGLSPHVAITAAYIKDSDQPPQPSPAYREGGLGGASLTHLNGVVNPTSDLTVLGWQKIKYEATKKFLDFWAGRNSPNKLVIIHSAGDVLYGGCDEATMQYKYQQIIDAAGGTQKIILGAEVAPYPSDVAWSYTTETAAQMTAVLGMFGLSDTWASAYASCSGKANSICDATPKYGYANAGFIMGPVADVAAMLSALEHSSDSENRVIQQYFIDNTELVTLDYSGSLSMSLHNMVKDGELPVEVDGKSIKSKVTNSKVCFVQGNGNSFEALKGLATALKA